MSNEKNADEVSRASDGSAYYEFPDGPHAGLKVPAGPIDKWYKSQGRDAPKQAHMMRDHVIDASGIGRAVDLCQPDVVAVGRRVEGA